MKISPVQCTTNCNGLKLPKYHRYHRYRTWYSKLLSCPVQFRYKIWTAMRTFFYLASPIQRDWNFDMFSVDTVILFLCISAADFLHLDFLSSDLQEEKKCIFFLLFLLSVHLELCFPSEPTAFSPLLAALLYILMFFNNKIFSVAGWLDPQMIAPEE